MNIRTSPCNHLEGDEICDACAIWWGTTEEYRARQAELDANALYWEGVGAQEWRRDRQT